MKITTKTNGYTIGEELKTMIERVEYAVSVLFPEWEIDHFYYGDKLSMTDVRNKELKQYIHLNITAKRVSINGYTLSRENLATFEGITWNDELYKGKLLDLVNF